MTEPLGSEDSYKKIDERSCGEGFKEERTTLEEEAKMQKAEIRPEGELHEKVTMMEITLRQHEDTIDALRLKIENLERLLEYLQQVLLLREEPASEYTYNEEPASEYTCNEEPASEYTCNEEPASEYTCNEEPASEYTCNSMLPAQRSLQRETLPVAEESGAVVGDFESRFNFHAIDEFPPPEPYECLDKTYPSTDFESRFNFHAVDEFPAPEPYECLEKTYPSTDYDSRFIFDSDFPQPAVYSSLQTTNPSDDFESRFNFHAVDEFPPPEPYECLEKTYPSTDYDSRFVFDSDFRPPEVNSSLQTTYQSAVTQVKEKRTHKTAWTKIKQWLCFCGI